jgi:hypothetical protein
MAHPGSNSQAPSFQDINQAHPIPTSEPFEYAARDHSEVVSACDVYIEQEPYKMAIIRVTNAVVDPWTVMLRNHEHVMPA